MGSKFIRFAILISLIGGLPHSHCVEDVQLEGVEYEKAKGMTVQHALPFDLLTEVLEECHVITPDGKIFELYPNVDVTDSTIEYDKHPLWDRCAVKISPLTTSHNGKWILRGLHQVTSESNEISEKLISQEIDIKVQEEYTEPEKVVTSTRGGSAHHEMPTREISQKLVTCTVKTSKGIYFELYPNFNVTDDNIKFYQSMLIQVCGIDIANISVEYVGKWEMKAALSNPDIVQNQVLEIKINEKISTIPTTATVYEGSDVSFALSEVVKDHKCSWKSPLGQEIVVDTLDTCALKLTNVTLKDLGTWVGSSEGEITLYGHFNLGVKEIPAVESSKVLKKGYSGELTFGPSDTIFCFAISPMGETFPHNTGVCKINIEKTTHKHNGIWQAHVGLRGKLNTVIYYYDVKVEEENLEVLNNQKIISSFSKNENNLQISCSMVVDSLKTCHMLRSDGKLLSISYDGVGYEHYTGYSKKENNSATCGLIINYPTEIDQKNWKCLMVHGENNEERSAVISLQKSLEIESSNSIETVMGSTYDLKCSIPEKINYCWFLLPNGTRIFVHPGIDNDDYEYFGNGLDAGECGIKIKKIAVSDSGTWKCSMGVEFYSDLQASIDVQVHENVLIPIQKTLIIARDITIGCKTFDNSPVDYCRFVRPDGIGLNPLANFSTYGAGKTNLENGVCELQILRPLYNDLGTWICAAKSMNENEEYHNKLFVMQYYYWVSYSTSLYTFMWVILTLTIVLMIAILCTSNRGKRIRRRTVEITRSFSIRKENLHTPE